MLGCIWLMSFWMVHVYLYALDTFFAEMFPQAIDFGTDGINFFKCFYNIKYIWFYYVCFFQNIDFMLDGSLVFGTNPRFYAYYTVIADPAFWFACCYLEISSAFCRLVGKFITYSRSASSMVDLSSLFITFLYWFPVMVYSSQSISGKLMFPHTHMVSLGYLRIHW